MSWPADMTICVASLNLHDQIITLAHLNDVVIIGVILAAPVKAIGPEIDPTPSRQLIGLISGVHLFGGVLRMAAREDAAILVQQTDAFSV